MVRSVLSIGVAAVLALASSVTPNDWASASLADHFARGAPLPSIDGSQLAIYGEAFDASSGYEYVDFVAGGGAIGPLSELFTVGTFANNDFTKEYAIEYPGGGLATIDTTTAATTDIGNTGLGSSVTGMRWNPADGTTLAVRPGEPCDDSALYTVDLSSAATTPIATLSGTCAVAMAIDSAGTIYLLDATTETLQKIDEATGDIETIGPLGIPVDDTTSMDFDPSSGILYLVSGLPGGSENDVYIVDTSTGLATLIEPLGSDSPITAFALGQGGGDMIFEDGFDSTP